MSETATLTPAAVQAPSATFGFVKIVVKDVEGAVSFYERVLGMVLVQTIELPGLVEKVLRKRGTEAGPTLVLYHHTDGREIVVGNGWGPVGFYVRDVDASFAHAVAQGAKGTRPPFDT